MKKVAVYLLSLLFVVPLFAQKKAFTIADLYHIKGISDPRISPDGKKIAFVVTKYSLEEGKSNSEIYLMNTDGSGLRQLTSNDESDSHPRWSPDGKSLMFVSSRSGKAQAWMLPLDGGEARQITDFYTSISNPEWSPSGNKIAYSAKVFPECGSNSECNSKIWDSLENGPLQAHMADHLLYRHWTTWQDGRRPHILIHDTNTDQRTDLTPGDYDSPSFSLAGATGFAFSPDGSEMCYVSNHDSNEAESTNKDLWLVSTSGGAARNITQKNKAYDGDPAYSPDGKYIAFRMQTKPGYESDLFRLALYDRKTGQINMLTNDFDYWVDDFKWAPDSRSIYFTADYRGHVPLFKVDLKTQKVSEVLDAKTIDNFSLAPDGKWITFTRRSIAEPSEVYRANINGQKLTRLTFLNKSIEDSVDIRPAEEMWIPSKTGVKVHTFIVKPHNFDPNKKYPLIINVHGGPQSQWEDAFRGDWQVYPGAGYVLAFPNPHGSTGYGQKFTTEISADWGGQVYQDIMSVTDSLANLSYVDSTRMGAMGWSYGGYMMMWLEGHTDRFKAIVSMMGVYDLTAMFGATEELWFPEYDLGGYPWTSELFQKWSPNNFVKNFKTPCQVIIQK
ncbi:MAG: S9 family peptidase [Calditrichia bacterium]